MNDFYLTNYLLSAIAEIQNSLCGLQRAIRIATVGYSGNLETYSSESTKKFE
jgi:hypothetical protein